MPMLPRGSYGKVIIHDNFKALERFADSKGRGALARQALANFNGRFVRFRYGGATFIATGMGSAQTNYLVESLATRGCEQIVKVGTCSALDRRLQEGDIIVPRAALVDEGATFWRHVKSVHHRGGFRSQASVSSYVCRHRFVRPDSKLRACGVARLAAAPGQFPHRGDIRRPCVWSVDSYDCFNGCPQLYGKVDGRQYSVADFFTGRAAQVCLVGVEMECSALFAAGRDASIPAVALIIVSRTRARLLGRNIDESEHQKSGMRPLQQGRATYRIQDSEMRCLEVALTM